MTTDAEQAVPQPVTERDFYNNVWAEEGGVHVSIHRDATALSSVVITIDKDGEPLRVATVAGYRWLRLIEWLDKERP